MTRMTSKALDRRINALRKTTGEVLQEVQDLLLGSVQHCYLVPQVEVTDTATGAVTLEDVDGGKPSGDITKLTKLLDAMGPTLRRDSAIRWIEKFFPAVKKEKVDKAAAENQSSFVYDGAHYVFRLKAKWSELFTWDFDGAASEMWHESKKEAAIANFDLLTYLKAASARIKATKDKGGKVLHAGLLKQVQDLVDVTERKMEAAAAASN